MHHEPELGASAAALDHPQERRTPPMKQRAKGTIADQFFSSVFKLRNEEIERDSDEPEI